MKLNPKILRMTVKYIRKRLVDQQFWELVQDDVKTSLMWIIERVDELGIRFKDAFISQFLLQAKMRELRGEAAQKIRTVEHASALLLGDSMSDEAYQCGKGPVRSTLDLYDYIEPNYADVRACLYACRQIEILASREFLEPDDVNPSRGIKMLKNFANKGRTRKGNKGKKGAETIYWTFDE